MKQIAKQASTINSYCDGIFIFSMTKSANLDNPRPPQKAPMNNRQMNINDNMSAIILGITFFHRINFVDDQPKSVSFLFDAKFSV
jgi:hypothetical protein